MPAEIAADKVTAAQKDDAATPSLAQRQQKASLAGEPTAATAAGTTAGAEAAAERSTNLAGLSPFELAGNGCCAKSLFVRFHALLLRCGGLC